MTYNVFGGTLSPTLLITNESCRLNRIVLTADFSISQRKLIQESFLMVKHVNFYYFQLLFQYLFCCYVNGQ